jgi:hypothetical protein
VRSIIHRPLFSLATALISAFTGLAVAAAPGVCADLPPLRADHSPYFSADIVTALDTDGRPALGVSITVPYQELSWVRPTGDPGDTRLAARAEFTIVFDPGKSKALDGDVWERRVVVAGYSAARSPNSVMLEKRTFKVPPGRYELRISVRDMNAEVQSSAAEKVDVPDYSKITVGFTDLELGLSDSAGTFIPVPTRVMGLEVTRLAARVALFDRRGGEWPRQYPLHFRLLDDAGEALREGDTTVTIAHSGDPVTIRPPATELFLGHYTFEVELSDHKSKWRRGGVSSSGCWSRCPTSRPRRKSPICAHCRPTSRRGDGRSSGAGEIQLPTRLETKRWSSSSGAYGTPTNNSRASAPAGDPTWGGSTSNMARRIRSRIIPPPPNPRSSKSGTTISPTGASCSATRRDSAATCS